MGHNDVQSTDPLACGVSRRPGNTDDRSPNHEGNVYLKHCDPHLREHLLKWYECLPQLSSEPIHNSQLLADMFSLAGFPITAILLLDVDQSALLPTYLSGDVPEEFKAPICFGKRLGASSFADRALNSPGEPVVGTRLLDNDSARTCIGSALTDNHSPFGILYVEELVTTGPRRNLLLTFKALMHALRTGLNLTP
jgi:hypothetical protein